MKRTASDAPPGSAPAKRPTVGLPAARPGAAPGGGRLTTNDALAYLREVKERFKDSKHVYDSFLEVMKQFKAQQIDTNGVIAQVKQLFKGHRELILGFNTFLPKGYEIQLKPEPEPAPAPPKARRGPEVKQPVEFDQAISYVNKIKSRFMNNERVYKAFLEILNMYRKEEKSIAQVYDEVAALFRHHSDLLEEFTHFLPDSAAPPRGGAYKKAQAARAQAAKAAPAAAVKRKVNRDVAVKPEEDPKNKAAHLARELQFFERVKARLRNRDLYNEFLKCLNIFTADVVSKMELRGLAYDILSRFPDLLTGFDEFVERCESMDFETAEAGRAKMSSKDVAKMKIISAREKFLSRPISELDLSMCDRCGPSYRLLPKGFPRAPTSARTALHFSVLNDNWVSVTSGSEDFSFKAMRKNQYEESLFRCEDDRFELDMVIETNASALARLQAAQQQIAALASAEERAAFRFADGALSPVHLRSVERLYGDHGADVREALLRAPAAALPVVLARLVQKDAEWRRVRDEMKPVWADVYTKNYNKSLDHRSFYFKQTDKKSLSAKGMLTELREASDKRRLAEEVPLGGSGAPALRAAPPSPDMSFTYGDRAVHDDVFAIVKFSALEMMTDEGAAQLVQLWQRFVEPFFAIARPADGSHGYVDDTAERAAVAVLEQAQAEEEAEAAAARGGAAPAAAAAAGEADAEAGAKGKTGLAAAAAAGDGGDDEDAGDEPPRPKGRAAAAAKEAPASSGDDAGEGESDGAGSARLGGVKPLAYGAAQPAQPAAADAERVFYGHEPFLLLFRLHRHLYERLAAARASAASARGAGWAPSETDGGFDAAAAAAAAGAHTPHGAFMHLLFRLLSGNVEASRYEDDCRQLLGANAYVLFTLDKLIYKLIKQLQALSGEETVKRLLALQAYEAARGARSAAQRDAQYAADAAVLLPDEPAFRVAACAGGAVLTLQQLEVAGDKGEGGGALDPRFAAYLAQFLSTARPAGCAPGPLGAAGSPVRRLFLARSLQPPLPRSLRCANGLECKLSCATSKVSYVLDTADFLRCAHAPAAQRRPAGAVPRFRAWVARKLES